MGCVPSRPGRRSSAGAGGGSGGAAASKQPDEDLGHSFRYSRSSSIAGEASFKLITGAALSANSSAPLPSLPFRSFSSSSSSSSALFLSGPLDSSGLARACKPSLLRRSLSEKNRPLVVPLRSFRRPDLDLAGQSVQWAHGKAGEDRVQVVVSEDPRWLFVGIYDGFNGPDAPEFLVSRLYPALLLHLQGLFWIDGDDDRRPLWEFLESPDVDAEFDLSGSGRFAFSLSRLRLGLGKVAVPARWRVAREEEKFGGVRRRRRRRTAGPVADHGLVLRALSRALEATEMEYLEMTDRAMASNPELALTGSCVLVVLVRDDDVYVMNLGDSRAIVAQRKVLAIDDGTGGAPAVELAALQLSMDHSTSIQQEVQRIKEEHPDDDQCIVNHRVKGRLKVTRAFGAGFLKQAKWNDGLLEMFRNKYIGGAPYISSEPFLCHYKLGPDDQFLVLSSDGLYQYLSNEEVVSHVEHYLENFPDGDPAQSLIEELLSRAAKKAGMELSELLEIPQGDRRKYHDDVTVMIISLEGRIWKSSGKCL